MISSALALRSTKTTVIGSWPPNFSASAFSSRSSSHSLSTFCESTSFSRCCATFDVGTETAPTFTLTGLLR